MSNYMHYAVIISCLILLLFLIIAEFKRANKAFLIFRILGNIIAITSLALMFIPLNYETKVATDNAINLFSAGTNQDSVPREYKVGYAMDSIPDLSYFLKSKPEISTINVFGYGLEPTDLDLVKRYKFNFYPAPKKGTISAHWKPKLSYTEEMLLQGTYVNPGSNEVKLILGGYGTNLDSVTILAGKTREFSLKCIPRQAGKAVFSLLASTNDKILAEEKVPVEVVEAKPMTVLLMSSNPDFEYKFLKTWLYEEGHAVMMRSRISKSAVSSDFLNTKQLDLSTITGEALQKVNVLICDEHELGQVSNQEYQRIEQAVSKGMGLIVRITDSTSSNNRSLLKNLVRYELPSTNDKNQQRIFLRASTTGLVSGKDNSQRIVSLTNLFGRGKVTGSVLLSTYQWLLESKGSVYKRYWSDLIGNTSDANAGKSQFELFPQLPAVNERLRILAIQEGQAVPGIKFNNSVLKPRQNVVLSNEWDAVGFPNNVGWNTLAINDKQHSIYIYQTDSWQDLRNNAKSMSNIKASKLSSALKSSLVQKTVEKKIPVWIFFLTFLISAGFLWVEPKISYRNDF